MSAFHDRLGALMHRPGDIDAATVASLGHPRIVVERIVGRAMAQAGRSWSRPGTAIDAFCALDRVDKVSILGALRARSEFAATEGLPSAAEEAMRPVVAYVDHADRAPTVFLREDGLRFALDCTPSGMVQALQIRLHGGDVLQVSDRLDILPAYGTALERPGDDRGRLDDWHRDAGTRARDKRFFVGIWNAMTDDERIGFLTRVVPKTVLRKALKA